MHHSWVMGERNWKGQGLTQEAGIHPRPIQQAALWQQMMLSLLVMQDSYSCLVNCAGLQHLDVDLYTRSEMTKTLCLPEQYHHQACHQQQNWYTDML